MIPKHLVPLANAVAVGYGIELVELIELVGGNDPLSKLYRAATEAGEQFFIKQRSGTAPGISLSAALRDAGIEAVLAPLQTLDGEIALTLADHVVLLYPFKEGHNGFDHPLKLRHWQLIGVSLRRIHDAVLPKSVLEILAVESFRVKGVAEFVATKDRLLTESALSPPEDALAVVIRNHLDSISYVMQRAWDLGTTCSVRHWDMVPCHADLHVGNVLIEPNGNALIIDWDSPRLAPRECDLLFFCNGGILHAHGDVEEASFFEGYGAFEPDSLVLTYYRYARVLEDFVAYAQEAVNSEVGYAQRMAAVKGFEAQFQSMNDGSWFG